MVSRRVPYIDRALWVRIPDRNLFFEVEPGNLPGVRDVGRRSSLLSDGRSGPPPLAEAVEGLGEGGHHFR